VAEILGLSRSKTYDLVAQGEIPPVPLAGRRRLIARLTVEQLLASEQPRHWAKHAGPPPHSYDPGGWSGGRHPSSPRRRFTGPTDVHEAGSGRHVYV